MDYNILQRAHSGLRWIVLALLISAVLKALIGMFSKSSFTATDKKISLLTTIFCDIQLLIGLIMYIIGPLGIKNIQNLGMGEVMKNSFSRFFAIEHIVGMLIAIILIHIGKSKAAAAVADEQKHKRTFVYFILGLLIILFTIPWPFKNGFEHIGWF